MFKQNENSRFYFLFGMASGIALISVVAVIILLVNGGNFLNPRINNVDKKIAADADAGKPKSNITSSHTSKSSGKITVNSDDHIRGDKNAPVALVEFSDYQCPYCKRFHSTMRQIMDEYQGKARWIYRHFPLSFHKNAQKSAEAAECAGDQGEFWEYGDELFKNSQPNGDGLDLKDLKRYAKEIGLDIDKFNDCLSSGKFVDKIRDDMASGRAAGVKGTPGTIIIGKDGNTDLISGALTFSQIKAKIDAALK